MIIGLIDEFDRIFIFEKGYLRESGSHEELLQIGGLYRHLWDKQTGFVIDADQALTTVTPERLRAIPFLAGCDEITLEVFVNFFASERFIENRTIFEMNDPGDKFYIIARGSLEVFAPQKDDSEIQLGILSDGDFL